jgi:hypothetical protein
VAAGKGKVLVHIGHYGSGKTELSLNEVLDLAAQGQSVALIDLDIVNPFFRSGEQRSVLEAAGIKVIAPLFVNKTVEVPALPPEVLSAFTGVYDCAVLDVGGDPAGATALGRYHDYLEKADKWVRCVVNTRRPFTSTPEDIADMARQMEERGRIRIDALVNNTNLSGETTAELILSGERTVADAAAILSIPMEFTMARRDLAEEVLRRSAARVLPVDMHIKPVWL